MAIFNRAAYEQVGNHSRYGACPELPVEDIAIQAVALQYTAAERIDSAIVEKRVFDIFVASIAIAIATPIMLLAAVAIKLDSPGPIFFMQERIGLNRRRNERRAWKESAVEVSRSDADRRKNINAGRPFNIYKFRTMVRDAEKGVPTLARDNDPRITRVGRFLRKTRIDEIPQFINVIKGDMSIIGPRPERSFFINKVKREVPEFTMRLMVKPGITGLAQVEHGYAKTIGEMRGKLFYDLKYIADLSLTQEIKILFKTAYVVVTGKGAC
jgi:lipopolysaccharide/colanic/teichoic acid biosynthesis glycosyltransferase